MTTPGAQWLTLAFLALVTALVVAYDVFVIASYGPDVSISRVLSRLCGRWPSIGLALVFWIGVLVGHVWLPAR
jgi:hypothetical protein